MPLVVEVTTGSCRRTSRSPTGSRLRVLESISLPSGSFAMSAVMSRIAESGLASYRNGTTVRRKSGISRTSTAIRPVSGILSTTPRPASRVPIGSTSTTISRPSLITWPGISAFADRDSALSSISVGIGPSPPAISTTCNSAPPW